MEGINKNRVKITLIIFQTNPINRNPYMLKTGRQSWRQPLTEGTRKGAQTAINSRQPKGVESTEASIRMPLGASCIIPSKRNKNFNNRNTVILSSEKTSTFVQPAWQAETARRAPARTSLFHLLKWPANTVSGVPHCDEMITRVPNTIILFMSTTPTRSLRPFNYVCVYV